MSDLAFAPALEQARLVRDREVSSRELVELYLRRIEAHDHGLNSYVRVLADQARQLAAAKDQQTTRGGSLPPFHGVPVSIKEMNLLAGSPATMGSRALADLIAPTDDEVVARLRRAGMVPLGKTNVPELGTVPYTEPVLFGAARNPWNRGHTPGGSSGGAAAALAAGLCPAAQGSDGGGSLRIPASNTGVVGLKPTRDRVSNAPLFGDIGFGFVAHGMLTRTVADGAAFLDVLAGYVPGDPGMLPPPARPFRDEVGRDPGRVRIGVFRQGPDGPYAPQVRDALDDVCTCLEQLGHEVVESDGTVPDHVTTAFEETWAALVASQPLQRDMFEPINQWLAEWGDRLTGGEVLANQFHLQLFCRGFQARFHDEFDQLVFPVVTRLPLRVGELSDLEPPETWAAVKDYVGVTPLINATGQPAVSLPLHRDAATGLPIGMQLVGRFADEASVLRLAGQLEAARPWHDDRPPGVA